MRIYVAGKWSRRAEASALMRALEAGGHVITWDWTAEDATRRDAVYFEECAEADMEGVLSADVLLLIHDPACRGAYWEAGAAAAANIPIAVIGAGAMDPATNCPIFYFMRRRITHLATAAEAVAALS